jgi:alpha,alpha-trehalase
VSRYAHRLQVDSLAGMVTYSAYLRTLSCLYILLWTCFGGLSVGHVLPVPLAVVQATCTHPIYCTGPLLDFVQRSGLFNDSKYFVDCATRKPLQDVLAEFTELQTSGGLADLNNVRDFLNQNFAPPGEELSVVQPPDWTFSPDNFLTLVADKDLLVWGRDLHERWTLLTRQYQLSAICEGCQTSSIPAKYPFVVPGGRFLEFYYWDTYWIIKGLLVSGMFETCRGMLLNYFDLVKQFGFVPNGNRIYYLNRSQPPLLTLMVKEYMEATDDEAFLRDALVILDQEYQFWMNYRLSPANVSSHLNRYRVQNSLPRPESYLEDMKLADQFTQPSQRESLFSEIATGAETGWDFSSRWFRDGFDMSTIHVTQVIPVDLNCFLHATELALAKMHGQLDQSESTTTGQDYDQLNLTQSNFTSHDPLYHRNQHYYYSHVAQHRREAIREYLWNETEAQWFDFDISSNKQNVRSYPTNFLPIWSGMEIDESGMPMQSNQTLHRVLQRFNASLNGFVGGIPTSLIESKQQWDFPNAW